MSSFWKFKKMEKKIVHSYIYIFNQHKTKLITIHKNASIQRSIRAKSHHNFDENLQSRLLKN